MLVAHRGSTAAAICPTCTLLVRPIFADALGAAPMAEPRDLAKALLECADAGANLINLSVAILALSSGADRELRDALDRIAALGVIVVAAAGNQGSIAASTITGHPWVFPVVACDLRGRPMSVSSLGARIARHGVSAPGDEVRGTQVDESRSPMRGTSIAAALVTGTIALLWSLVPEASAAEVHAAIAQRTSRATGIVPPLLNAYAAWQHLVRIRRSRTAAPASRVTSLTSYRQECGTS